MLEYAANGHYYWTAEMMRELAIETAARRERTIEQSLERLSPTHEGSTDEFFARVQDNLREGQIRMVFFMEESPPELRSVVDFLNKQMERAEVLLVEARQYKQDSTVVVMPMLFGYTEEARLVKRTVTVSSRSTRVWNESLYFEDVATRVGEEFVGVIRAIYQSCIARRKIRWGRGAKMGSVSFIFPDLWDQVLFFVYADGSMTWNWPYLRRRESLRDDLQARLTSDAGLSFPDEWRDRFVAFPATTWCAKSAKITEAIDAVRNRPSST